MPFVPLASDNFNRANETPLASPWATGSGALQFKLSGNVAVPSSVASDCVAIYTGQSWTPDQSSKAKLTVSGTNGGGAGVGLCCRHAPAAATFYRLAVDHAATKNCSFYRVIAGTFTQLSLYTRAFTDGDEWGVHGRRPATGDRAEGIP